MVIDLGNAMNAGIAVVTLLTGLGVILAGAFRLFRGAVSSVVEDQLKTSDGRSVVAVVEDQVKRLVANSKTLDEVADKVDRLANDFRELRNEHHSLGERVARLETYFYPQPGAPGGKGWFR
jgi:hypothetical protein